MGYSDPVCFNVDTMLPIVTIDPVTSRTDIFRLTDRYLYQTITDTFIEANIDRIVVNEEDAKLDKTAGTYSANVHLFWGNNLINAR